MLSINKKAFARPSGQLEQEEKAHFIGREAITFNYVAIVAMRSALERLSPEWLKAPASSRVGKVSELHAVITNKNKSGVCV